MKKANYYFTLFLVLFTTVFAFFNMFSIVETSSHVITILYTNLIPSLLPFMILISLCISLGLIHILSYFIQFVFCPLFHLTPIMSSLYFISFFCGYPTNAKMIKEAYLLHYITLDELQHLLSIASFSSLSFIFVSLSIHTPYCYIVYISHILPSLLKALTYKHNYHYLSFQSMIAYIKTPDISFVKALKQSISTSFQAFIFIAGYMLVFQFLSKSISFLFPHPVIFAFIQGLLEFSSGSLKLLQSNHIMIYPLISFLLSFSGISVLMQIDNILDEIPYRFKDVFFSRLQHAFLSFFICLIVLLFIL